MNNNNYDFEFSYLTEILQKNNTHEEFDFSRLMVYGNSEKYINRFFFFLGDKLVFEYSLFFKSFYCNNDFYHEKLFTKIDLDTLKRKILFLDIQHFHTSIPRTSKEIKEIEENYRNKLTQKNIILN